MMPNSAFGATALNRSLIDTLPNHRAMGNLFAEQMYRIQEAAADPKDPYLTLEEAYGPFSNLVVEGRTPIPYRELLTDHPIFQGVVLLLAVAFLLLVCAQLRDMLSVVADRRSGEPTAATPRAIYTAGGIGALLMAALVVRLAEGLSWQGVDALHLLVGSVVAMCAIAAYRQVVMFLIGRITLHRELMMQLGQMKAMLFGLATLGFAPLLLLSLFTPPGEGRVWFYLLILLLAGWLLLFIKESFVIFRAKKISILHWFLYLCAVECFPISLIVLLAVRW